MPATRRLLRTNRGEESTQNGMGGGDFPSCKPQPKVVASRGPRVPRRVQLGRSHRPGRGREDRRTQCIRRSSSGVTPSAFLNGSRTRCSSRTRTAPAGLFSRAGPVPQADQLKAGPTDKPEYKPGGFRLYGEDIAIDVACDAEDRLLVTRLVEDRKGRGHTVKRVRCFWSGALSLSPTTR